ncbi:WhiB family transcriptional regulator [Nonomuraea terrae]|uniref:WhiB family transcriptional regulator n=1 Tax=Nonomuraea terrae TaxID=2530383 RepID=UPI001FE6D166
MATPNWNWTERAACRGADLLLFFGRPGERIDERQAREARATAICGRCPVQQTCLQGAFERNEGAGVWGGLGEDERRSRRRAWQRRTSYERRADTAETEPVTAKWCPACTETKPAGDFPKDRRQSDGLNRYCKPCTNEANREVRARQRQQKEAVA